ncbi:MAG: hypothetical protein JNG82_01930 [Opitutaceae bacterium]|nr:hypothetical protein [Opitutaceae bacterium]
MNANLTRLIILATVALVVTTPSALAQRQLGKKKGPTSKIYLAEAVGESQIVTGEKLYTAKQATAFDAPGTVIETKEGAHNAYVYSNGTGMFVDESTRVEIDRFVQEPFQPNRDTAADVPYEPSISQSEVHVARGAVGICTSQLVSGSSMLYTTPQASMNIRGGKVSIQTNANETVIDLLDGDLTVRGSSKDVGGQILRPGERAIVRASAGNLAPTITISRIPQEDLDASDARVTVACNARKTVTFDIIEKKAEVGPDGPADIPSGGDQEIVVKPTIPAEPPINIVISPDRLPGN